MRTHDEHVAELMSWYHRADEDGKEEGRQWYSVQREVIRALAASHYMPFGKVAAVMAALSPMTRWTENVAGCIRILRAFEQGEDAAPRNCTLIYRNAEKAWAILHDADPHVLFTKSPKVTAFWLNLCGDEQAVTIDTWMLRAVGEDKLAANGCHVAAYRRIVDAVKDAAESVGEVPAQFQAIVWVQIRREQARFDTTKEAA
jgi:hypothetical protein